MVQFSGSQGFVFSWIHSFHNKIFFVFIFYFQSIILLIDSSMRFVIDNDIMLHHDSKLINYLNNNTKNRVEIMKIVN